jgi:hypothetical protein
MDKERRRKQEENDLSFVILLPWPGEPDLGPLYLFHQLLIFFAHRFRWKERERERKKREGREKSGKTFSL